MPITVLPGTGQGLSPLIQALISKQELDLRKEDQKLREKDFKLKQQEYQDEQERLRHDQEVAMQTAKSLIPIIAMRDQALAQQLRMTPPQALPGAVSGGLEALGSLAQTRATTAGAARTELETDIETEVRPETVAFRRGQVLQQFAETQGMTIQNALGQARQENDPARVAQAWDLMQTGELTWGQASAASGVSSDAIPSDFRLNPLAAGSGSESAVKAGSLYNSMKAADGTINQMVDAGTNLGLMGSIHRSATGPITSWASGLFTDDDERKLIQAQKSFADAYRFFISGQQSSDAEAARLLFTMLENPGDGPETIRQKRFMRQLTIGMAQQVANGALDPVQAAQRLLDTAISQDLPEEQIAVFRQQLTEAAEYTERGGPFASVVPSSSGGSVTNVPDLVNLGLGGDTSRFLHGR